MDCKDKASDGLSRTIEVVIGAKDLARRLEARIEEIRPQVRLKGFRPGKVPAAHIRKMFGRSMMSEIIEDAVNESSQKALEDRSIRPASFPEIHVESDIEKVATGASDLTFHMHVEVMPEFEPSDPKSIKLERPVAVVGGAEIEAALAELAKSQTIYEAKDGRAAEKGDQVLIDYVGKVAGVAFEGGSAEGAEIVLGANRLIEGFEDQLIGAKAGQGREVRVTFPEGYPREELAGKPAQFEVIVREVRAPKEAKVDDELAKAVGLGSLSELKDAVKANLEQDYAFQSRARLKRRLLDALDAAHSFDLPKRMVEIEFDQIWAQVKADLERGEVAPEDAEKSEDELKAEYEAIARRRVRLGLVLAEIGRRGSIEVSEEEVNRAISLEARRYRGREREVVRLYQENAQARAQLRAPIYEEKVVDYILELAQVSEATVTREELFKDE